MTVRARVIKAAEVQGLTPVTLLDADRTAGAASARIVPRAVAEAKAEASRVLNEARLAAGRVIVEARRAADELRLRALTEGRAAAVVELAAQHIALKEQQQRAAQQQLTRGTELATILAERLIGEALQLDPELVGRMAAQSLRQLRDRQALVVRAHSEDHAAISEQIALLGLNSVSLLADATLKRGELCIDSDLGRLELRFEPGLDRLVDRVRSLLHDEQ